MNKSPYDSLTAGSNSTQPEYVEVDLKEIMPGPAPELSPSPAPNPIPNTHGKSTSPIPTPPQYSHLNINNIVGTNSFILPFEESLLVPDTMADMEQVLFAEGRVDLSQPSKLSYGADDFLTGEVTVFTVYKPASSSGNASAGSIDVVKSIIPFKTDKCWGEGGNSYKVSVSMGNLTAEMINERKFVVRGDIIIKLTVLSGKKLKVFKGCSDDDLVVRSSNFTTSELLREMTETTEISQEIIVKEEEPSPVKILKESFEICESHRQITSGKLVIHGVIHSQVLYSGIGDETTPACLDNKTDFTQFILLNENIDPNMIMVHFSSSDLKMSIENRDKFILSGNVISHIQVYTNRTIDMVTDAYHKKNELVYDTETQLLNSIIGTVSGELSSREVINLGVDDRQMTGAAYPETLLCGSCGITDLDAHFENDRIVIEGALPVSILALDETGAAFVIDTQVPIRGSLSMSLPVTTAQPKLHVDATIRNFWFNKINNRQIEVNITLAVTVWAFCEEEFFTLENLRFADDVQNAPRASMAIYVVDAGETLWDIAKKYKTDAASLADANDLGEDDVLADGSKLFICR